MTEITVYGVAGSPYVRSVLLMLEEMGLAYRFDRMRPDAIHSPENLSRHPFGRVPQIDHGDFRLYETQAILRYLDTLHPEPALQPSNPRQAARMNQIIGVIDCYLFPRVSAPVGFPRLMAPRLGLPVDEAKVAAALPAACDCLRALGGLLSKGMPFVAADTLSLADLMLAPHIDYFDRIPELKTAMAGTPLPAWLAQMRARPSMKATAPERLMQAA